MLHENKNQIKFLLLPFNIAIVKNLELILYVFVIDIIQNKNYRIIIEENA